MGSDSHDGSTTGLSTRVPGKPEVVPTNEAVSLHDFLLGVQEAIKAVPAAWVRCELHKVSPKGSLGLGMLNGSIQHFLDFPHYAAVLPPLGVPVTLAAYMGRERLSLPRPQLLRLAAVAVVFTLALALGLDLLADGIAPHGHDH